MKRLPILFLLLYCGAANAQRGYWKQQATGFQAYGGSFLTNLPKAQYVRDSWSYFGEVFWEQQTDGSKEWHQANRLPQLGTGIFLGHTGSRQYMGRMAGLFSYVHLRLLRQGGFTSKFRIAGGLGWVEKPYDLESNHKGVLIGSYLNAYIQFAWMNEFRLMPGLYLNAGLNFSHLSNGSTLLPNLGLNIPSLTAGLRYGAAAPSFTYRKLHYGKGWQWSAFTGTGIKQAPWIKSRHYVINLLQGEGMRRFSYSDAYGGGLVLFYDRSLQVDPSGIPSRIRKGNEWQGGAYLAYEHAFGRLSLPVQVGAYVFNRDIYGALFQQIGLRFQLNQQWKAQFLMKTHSGKADYLHLGLGYQFKQ